MKKKICFIVARQGAAKSFLKEPMKKLVQDYDIYLATNFEGEEVDPSLPLCSSFDFPIQRHPSIFGNLKALWKLYRYFKKEKFFVVHSQAINASLLTAIAGFMARTPHRIRIFTGQLWCNMKGFRRWFYKFLDKVTVALDTDFLVDGKPQREFLIEQHILKEGQAEVLANGSIAGVNIDRFVPSEDIRKARREELGIKDDQIVLSFMGRLKREKGCIEILEAFNKYAIENKNIFLLLIGKDEENIINLIPNYENIKENINYYFYGLTSEPNELLQASDIFLLPSYREGFGMSAIEAACLGLPVICSDAYGLRDTLVDNVTGVICKVANSDSLYECMKKLCSDPAKSKEMGKAGRKRVVNDFSSELVSNSWLDFYRSLK